MINNTTNKNNISFQARFLFSGSKRETNTFVKFIKNEILDSDCPRIPISLCKQHNSTIVLTGLDCDLVEKESPILNLINAEEFYDKSKKGFLTNIIDFDPVFGIYEKIHSEIKQGIKTYFSTTHFGGANETVENTKVPKLDFSSCVNLQEALIIAQDIAKLGGHDLNEFRNAVRQCERFKALKVTGVVGLGQDSVIFSVDNNKVLRLSKVPCYPEKTEKFDLPIIDKGYIESKNKTIYYCISPKGDNYLNGKIKSHDVMNIIDLIEKSGYKTKDLLPNYYKQIVIYRGRPYLCDYDCATLSSGDSRLKKAH